MSDHRQKARDLVRLATTDGTPEKERVVASIQAVALINKYKLLDDPLAGIGDLFESERETISAASKLYDVARSIVTDPDIRDALNSLRGRVKGAARARRRRRR